MSDPAIRTCYGLGLDNRFTNDLAKALDNAELAFLCVAHGAYRDHWFLPSLAVQESGVCSMPAISSERTRRRPSAWHTPGLVAEPRSPTSEFLEFVYQEFRAVERGLANEVLQLIEFLNASYAADPFNRVNFEEVQRLAGTCITGCDIVDPGPIAELVRLPRFLVPARRPRAELPSRSEQHAC